MNFNAPLPLREQAKYHEGSKLASPRDTRNVASGWKKAQSTSQQQNDISQVLQKMSAQISKMRRKPLGGYAPQPFYQMFPFKIYQIQNVTATDAQKLIFKNAGLQIDDYTIQIRSGLVGARPYLNLPYSALFGWLDQGNFETTVYCTCTDMPPYNGFEVATDSDFYYPPTPNGGSIFGDGSSVILNDTTDTLINGLDVTTGASVNYSQIVLSPTVEGSDQFQNSSASFWIEIIEDVKYGNGLVGNLWGRTLAQDPPSATGNPTQFPQGSNIIPIGNYGLFADLSGSSFFPLVPFSTQMQSGNLVNRFPPGFGVYRGYWTDLFAALPSGSTYLVFYPGDSVIDDTDAIDFPAGIATGSAFCAFTCIATEPLYLEVSSNPGPTNSSSWKISGMIPS